MLAAEIWHWWIGVVLLIVAIAAGLGLLASYIKSVSSQNYPDSEQSRQSDL
jgi:formate-dependent nitrite reductase membrane component NrfD